MLRMTAVGGLATGGWFRLRQAVGVGLHCALVPEKTVMTRFVAALALIGLIAMAGAQASAVPTLKAKTKIVVVDVVVTDKEGRPVKDLKASDFALAENGAPQTISHFDAHTSLSTEDAAKVEAVPKLAPNLFTNYSPVASNGPVTVLIFDALNTKMSDQAVVLKQMLKYLDTPHPGVRMELFELNAGLKLIQGFTADPEILRAALTNRKAASQASALMDKPLSDEATEITMADVGESGWIHQDIQIDMKNALGPGEDLNLNRGSQKGFQLWSRQSATLDAMAGLAHYLGGLPGRKNLLWFSGSFPIPQSWPDMTAKLHQTMALLAKSQVAVYPIVAYGLQPDLNTVKSPVRMLQKTDNEYRTMDAMAEDTGGKVFANSNDFAGAAAEAIDDGSNYYTLTYTPANRDWKGEFRKLEVKLAEKGYTLAYRPGYFAEDVDQSVSKAGPKTTAEIAPLEPSAAALKAAMEYGSPQPADIVLTVKVNPATGTPESAIADGNGMSPKVAGPFERYVLSVAAAAAGFTFTQDAAGKHHLAAKLETYVYTADGAMINSTIVDATGDFDDARYRSIMDKGVQFKLEISVPLTGESFLRIGVEDLPTNRVGVVEIPVAMAAKLKPLMSSGATVPR